MGIVESVVRSRKYLCERGFLEKVDAQDLYQSVEIALDLESLADDGHEHVNRDGDPELGLDRVGRGAKEALDPEMLLDPLEEELDLPARGRARPP